MKADIVSSVTFSQIKEWIINNICSNTCLDRRDFCNHDWKTLLAAARIIREMVQENAIMLAAEYLEKLEAEEDVSLSGDIL